MASNQFSLLDLQIKLMEITQKEKFSQGIVESRRMSRKWRRMAKCYFNINNFRNRIFNKIIYIPNKPEFVPIRSNLNPYATPYFKGEGHEWKRMRPCRALSRWDNFKNIWIKNRKGSWKAAGKKWQSLTEDQRACWSNHNDALIAGLPGI